MGLFGLKIGWNLGGAFLVFAALTVLLADEISHPVIAQAVRGRGFQGAWTGSTTLRADWSPLKC
jgi:hypothetical protein